VIISESFLKIFNNKFDAHIKSRHHS
jgi:hypothetical protein